MTSPLHKQRNFSGRKTLPLFLFIFVILSMGAVSAVPPVQTNTASDVGFQIFYPAIEQVPQYGSFKLHIHVSNKSTGYPLLNTEADCFLHLYDIYGNHTFEGKLGLDSNGQDWDVFIASGNFSTLGQHGFYMWCNNSVFGGEEKGTFEVTPQGYTSALDSANYKLFIILVLISVGLFLLAYLLDSDWMIFLSGILWILTGMYGMIYGIGNLANLYTQGVSGIIIAIGLVFIIASVFNIAGDRRED